MLNREEILSLKSSEVIRWPVPLELEAMLSTTAREESVAAVMKSGDALAGAQLQNAVTPDQIVEILAKSQRAHKFPMPSGIGIELGAGVGMFSVVVANIPEVERVLALELVPSFLEQAIPAAANQLVNSEYREKIVPVYGSFEDLRIQNDQLDFIIQIESLHHSYEPYLAAQECFRTLKSGGRVYSIDRSHPDETNADSLTELLEHKYPKSWLLHHGYPIDKDMTRRDNGEHEYRDSEWKNFFETAGFRTRHFIIFAPRITRRQALKRLLELILPSNVSSRKFKIPARKGTLRTYILQKIRFGNLITGSLPFGSQARWQTLMIFEKP